MACESNLSFGATQLSSFASTAIALASVDSLAAQFSSFYPTYTCEQLRDFVVPLYDASLPANGFVMPGFALDLSTVDFSAAQSPTVTWSMTVSLDGVTLGQWIWNGTTLNNTVVYPGGIITIGSATQFLAQFDALPSGTPDIRIPISLGVTGISTDYVACVIPACAIVPVSTPPVIRTNILLANHSQFFNPFGIQGF